MNDMTVKEMMIYVEVAFENLQREGRDITKDEILKEISFLAYHQNKNSVLRRKNYVEKFF